MLWAYVMDRYRKLLIFSSLWLTRSLPNGSISELTMMVKSKEELSHRSRVTLNSAPKHVRRAERLRPTTSLGVS